MTAFDERKPRISNLELVSIDAVLEGMEARNKHELTIEVTPIAGRKIHGNMLTVGTSIGAINFGDVAGFRSRGIMSNDHFTIGSHYATSDHNIFLGNDIVPGDICWLPARREYTATQSSQVKFCAVMVDPVFLESALQRLGYAEVPAIFKDQGFCSLPNGIARMLSTLIPALKRKVLAPDSGFLTDKMAEQMVSDLLEHLLQLVLGNVDQNSISLGFSPGDKILRELENFLSSSQGEISISEFCRGIGISRRTLHRSITTASGSGPMDFQRTWKLAKVRNELLSGGTDTVTEAATRWGFRELGRFSQYYKNTFAELPSETLERTQDNS